MDVKYIKNIVVINQPLGNRGDESAHRSLLRAMDKSFPESKITVLFLNGNEEAVQDFIVKSPRIKYQNITGFTKAIGWAMAWSIRLNMLFVTPLLYPVMRKYAAYIKNSDLVVCAPGGICMGGFQSWTHIFNLCLTKHYKKRLVYYSRSFGPFPEKTKWNRIFKKTSHQLLNSFDYLSIRDKKTMLLADKLNLSYVPSIDTAFLDTPEVEIPAGILDVIDSEKFIVFVPNSLTWHTAYKKREQEDIDSFFLEIFKLIESKDLKVLMLPQLTQHVTYSETDYDYFLKLKNIAGNKNVVVLKDTYSSDIQQKIISKAELVIGARYHSVVFAINNNTPFISLSYEHKMTGLLNILNLNDREINIEDLGTKEFDKENALQNLKKMLNSNASELESAKKRARKIAVETFEKFDEFCNCSTRVGYQMTKIFNHD